MSEQKKFTPGRGKFALKKDALDEKTEAGVIFTPREDPNWVTGVVAAVGDTELTESGNPIPFDIPVGTRVLVTRKDGYDAFGSFMIFKHKSVVAVIDKDAQIG